MRGIPEIMVGRSLMLRWYFGALLRQSHTTKKLLQYGLRSLLGFGGGVDVYSHSARPTS